MVKLPFKTVTILGKEWTVEPTLDFEDDCFGATKVGLCVIQYDPRLPVARLRDIILHELKHAVAWESGLSYMLDDVKTEVTEETMIRTQTGPELDMLRSNPKFTRWLTRKDR